MTTKKKGLFLIPYAGGSRYSLRYISDNIDKNIEVINLELPGRGNRSDQELLQDIESMVEDLFTQIISRLNTFDEYYLFGHSLGALLCYLVSIKVIKNKIMTPSHIFISGRKAPSAKEGKKKLHLLPEKEFRKKLMEIGGCP